MKIINRLQKLKSKKLYCGCVLVLLLLCIIFSSIAIYTVINSVAESNAKDKFYSDLDKLIDKGQDAQDTIGSLDSLEIGSTEYSLKYVRLITDIEEVSKQGEKLLDDSDYKEYDFYKKAKPDLEAIAQTDDKLNQDFAEFEKAAEYYAKHVLNLTNFNQKINEGKTDNTTGLESGRKVTQQSLDELKKIAAPESMKKLQTALIHDYEKDLKYYDQKIKYSKQLDTMQRTGKYTVSGYNSVVDKYNSTVPPKDYEEQKVYKEVCTTGIFSDENFNKFDAMTSEFEKHLNQLVNLWNDYSNV